MSTISNDDPRLALLLGVPEGTPVTVVTRTYDITLDCRCCEGEESETAVSGGGRELVFAEPEHLAQHLTYAGREPVTELTLKPLLARDGTFHVSTGRTGEVKVFPGRVGNVRGMSALIVTAGENLRTYGLGHLGGTNALRDNGEFWIWLRTDNILAFEVDNTRGTCHWCKTVTHTPAEIKATRCDACTSAYACPQCGEFNVLSAIEDKPEGICTTCRIDAIGD